MPALDTSSALPVAPVRLMSGAAPYSATGGSDCCNAISKAAYYPRRPPQPSRRWHDTVAALLALQGEYAAWHDVLPDNLRESATVDALQEIIDLDLDTLYAISPPRGYGRD